MKKLIVALLVLPMAAPAAKLCKTRLPSFAQNNSANVWAAGEGCGGQYTGDIASMTSTGEKTGTDPAAFCTKRYASGESAYGVMPIEGQITGYPWSDEFLTTASASGSLCWCRMTWPYASKWTYVVSGYGACATFCAGFVDNLFL
ncbi:MAG: hypothetical protein LBL46_04465 [Rickettsiales bacterium]|jgi:hypothetical protein|nr:hypothetical protein [Rickettsiales bacterium]